MPYIIDGNNLIGASPEMSLEDSEAKEKLTEILNKYQMTRNNNIILIFDGPSETSGSKKELNNKFTVIYCPEAKSASEKIKSQLTNYNNFKDVVLITSDKELKKFGKNKGAKVINAIEFYYELKRFNRINGKKEESQKRIDAELSDNEVDQWMKIFDN